MDSIENLSAFFKFFEFCGLQHFSLQDVIRHNQSKRSKWLHRLHFCSLLIVNLFAIIIHFHYLLDSIDEKILATHFLTLSIRIVFSIGFIAAVIAGLVESLINKKKFQMIIVLMMKISKIFATDLNSILHYSKFKKWLAVKVSVFYLLTTVLIASILLSVELDIAQAVIFLLLTIPQVVTVTILIVFNFYIELVNFQLENLVYYLSQSFSSIVDVRNKRSDRNNILIIRQCYHLICEMSKLVNIVFRYSILIVMVVMIIGAINKTYEELITQILNQETKKILGKDRRLCIILV